MAVSHQPMAVFQGANVQNGGPHVVPPPYSIQQFQHMQMSNPPSGEFLLLKPIRHPAAGPWDQTQLVVSCF